MALVLNTSREVLTLRGGAPLVPWSTATVDTTLRPESEYLAGGLIVVLADTPGPPVAASVILGDLVWCGVYDATKVYSPGQLITVTGAPYICLQTSYAHAPASSPTYWAALTGSISGGGQGSPTYAPGNLGSTFTLDLNTHPAGLIGTLNANCALTVSNLSAGAQALLLLSQDATGSRTLTINGDVVSIPPTANAKFALQLDYDGTNLNTVLLGGGNGVTSVTATDGSIVVGGTGNAPTVATATLDVIASTHPPAAAWSNNSKKITGLANGSSAQDAAAFGQIPTALPPNGSAGGKLSGTYPNPGLNAASTDLSDSSALARIVETVNVVATSGSTQTIPDVTSDTASRIVLSANCTLTFPTAAAGKSFLLALVQDGTGSRTVTFPGSVKWPGGTAPTLTTTASKVDLFSFVCLDGSNWLGLTVGQNF